MFWTIYVIAWAVTLIFAFVAKLKLKSSTVLTCKFMGYEVTPSVMQWILNFYIGIAFIPYLNVIFALWGFFGSKFEK